MEMLDLVFLNTLSTDSLVWLQKFCSRARYACTVKRSMISPSPPLARILKDTSGLNVLKPDRR